MILQDREGFCGTIAGGRQPIRSQTYPGKEGDQSKLMKNLRILGIPRFPHNKGLNPLK